MSRSDTTRLGLLRQLQKIVVVVQRHSCSSFTRRYTRVPSTLPRKPRQSRLYLIPRSLNPRSISLCFWQIHVLTFQEFINSHLNFGIISGVSVARSRLDATRKFRPSTRRRVLTTSTSLHFDIVFTLRPSSIRQLSSIFTLAYHTFENISSCFPTVLVFDLPPTTSLDFRHSATTCALDTTTSDCSLAERFSVFDNQLECHLLSRLLPKDWFVFAHPDSSLAHRTTTGAQTP